MKVEIDEFVLANLFHYCEPKPEADAAPFWWRECHGEQNGYIMIWADGEHHHTYHYPPYIHE